MSEETKKSVKRRRVRLWHVLIAIVIALLVVAFLLRRDWLREYDRQRAALTAAGYPLTLEEVKAWYRPLASSRNGALAVVEAAEGYVDSLTRSESKCLDQLYVLGRRDPLEEEVKGALRRLIADNQETLDRLREAVEFDDYRYELDWSADSHWTMSPLPTLDEALRLLRYSTLLAIEEGRDADAMNSMVALLVISRSVGKIPTLDAFLTGTNSRSKAIDSLERGLRHVALTDAQLQRVQAVLWTDDTPERLERALASHMCWLLLSFENPVSQNVFGDLPPAFVLKLYRHLGLAAREGAIFLEIMELYLDVTHEPLGQWQAELRKIGPVVKEKLSGCLLLGLDGEFSLAHIHLRYLERVAKLRAAQAALAIERYRLAKGTLPVSLADLAPAYLADVPKDPFTGHDVRYDKLGTGYVVYSVGEDGRDDGGWEEPPPGGRSAGQRYDITFIVGR